MWLYYIVYTSHFFILYIIVYKYSYRNKTNKYEPLYGKYKQLKPRCVVYSSWRVIRASIYMTTDQSRDNSNSSRVKKNYIFLYLRITNSSLFKCHASSVSRSRKQDNELQLHGKRERGNTSKTKTKTIVIINRSYLKWRNIKAGHTEYWHNSCTIHSEDSEDKHRIYI